MQLNLTFLDVLSMRVVTHPISKDETNAIFYRFSGLISRPNSLPFLTEATNKSYQQAFANVIKGYARDSGSESVRILELGANDCTFASKVIDIINTQSNLKIDYCAVDSSEIALSRAISQYSSSESYGMTYKLKSRSGSIIGAGNQQHMLHLFQMDVNEFVGSRWRSQDIILLNELLDDLSYKIYFTDSSGKAYELDCKVTKPEERWHVHLNSVELGWRLPMPKGSITATSKEVNKLIDGISNLVKKNGIVLIHDYGFPGLYDSLENYINPRSGLKITDIFLPEGIPEFPKSFIRAYEDIPASLIQITSHVNFGEIEARLLSKGQVLIMPHGSAILLEPRSHTELKRGDDVFLSEFGMMGENESFRDLFESLRKDQKEVLESYFRSYSLRDEYLDLVFAKRAY